MTKSPRNFDSMLHEKLILHFKRLQTIRLTLAERQVMREQLLLLVRSDKGEEKKPNQEKQPLFWAIRPIPIAVMFLVLFFCGGTVYAAESSLPGEALYSVKLSVNETVRGWFTVSETGEAYWESSLLQRRLEEAEVLASSGQLSAETATTLETQVNNHANIIQQHVEQLKEEGKKAEADFLSNRLEASLEVHHQVLEKIQASAQLGEASMLPVESLHQQVQDRLQEASDSRAESESAIEAKSETTSTSISSATAERANNVASRSLTEARRVINQKLRELTSKNLYLAESELSAASSAFASAEAEFALSNFAKAYNLFMEANRLAMRAKLVAQTYARLPQTLDEIDNKLEETVEKVEGVLDRTNSESNNSSFIRAKTEVKAESNSGGNVIEIGPGHNVE